jgi:hypothetical protein
VRPFGGGSSVCGGVEPKRNDHKGAVLGMGDGTNPRMAGQSRGYCYVLKTPG